MALEERHKWKKPRGPGWFRNVIYDIYNEITAIQPIPGRGVSISQTNSGRQIEAGSGAGGGIGGAGGDYNFQLFDASDETGALVLILDGNIFGPNEDAGVDPDGMPSDDTYQIPVDDGDEIWIGLTYDTTTYHITSAWIDHGAATPDDTDDTNYITIGHVKVAYPSGSPSKVTYVRNEVCGDIYWIPPAPGDENTWVYGKDGGTGDEKWIQTEDCPCEGVDVIDGGGP